MGTCIARESGTTERDGLRVPFKPCLQDQATTLFTRRILFIISTGNMLGDVLRYMRIVPDIKKKQKTNRKLFYAAKKKYTRCLVKKCRIPANKIDMSGKQMNCVLKHCRKEDMTYSKAAFL